MGTCSLPTNCNQVCGTIKRMKEVFFYNDELYRNPFILSKIKMLQAHIKGRFFRYKFKLLHASELNIAFNPKNKPGTDLDLENYPIILTKNIQEMEERLGTFKFNEKEYYNTIFKKNLRKFSLMMSDQTIYCGYYNSKWLKEGYGCLYAKDGCKYEGFFENDFKHGQGRLLHIDGYYYDGLFLYDKCNGFGRYVNLDGSLYVGQWKDDKQHGLGEEICSNGSKYEGNYENGKI